VLYLLKKEADAIEAKLRWLNIGQIKGLTRNAELKNIKIKP